MRSPRHLRRSTWAVLLSLLLLVPALRGSSGQDLELPETYTICFVGNAQAERMQHHGWFETRISVGDTLAPVAVRHLGFSADEVDVAQRTQGFGTQDEHLDRCDANVVVGVWGFNESFAAPEGLEAYREKLTGWVQHVQAQRYTEFDLPTEVVLMGSIPFEDLGQDTVDVAATNARIRATNAVTREVAEALGCEYLDVYEGMAARYAEVEEPLTINGIHLTDRGNLELANVIDLDEMPPVQGDDPEALAIRELVLEKNLLWFNRYRATDGYNVYGGRSSLEYNGQTNFEVLQRELEVLDALCKNLDRDIWEAAGLEDVPADVQVPEQIAVATNKPGQGPDGEHVFQTGDDAVADMTLAEGMEIVCFADEQRFPELVNPVQMAFDPEGRLWVACWRTYPHWKPGEPMDDKLVVLEDTDGDGRADTCTTFADDLHNPTGFEFWMGGVVVANCPDLLFLKDTDGDGKADHQERWLHGLSSADTHHAANSFVFGPDGALYFQEGVFHQSQVESIHGPVRNTNACVWRFHPRTWRVERYIPYGFANPHGHVFDRWGHDFVTDGTGNNNYDALAFSGHLDPPAKHSGYFTFFPQRSRPAGATEILSSPAFPSDQQGDYLIANVIGFQGIFQYELKESGAGFGADETEPLVHSSDPNFRPVDMEVGPDGGLYFLDWHNPLIGHMQHHLRDPSRDQAHGRIYRVHHTKTGLAEPVALADRPTPELVALLADPSDRLRSRVRIELSGRPTDEVVGAVRGWIGGLDSASASHEHELLEGLWLQCQFDVLDEATLQRLLEAKDHRARAAATRVVRNLRHRIPDAVELLRRRAADEHPMVRLEAVVALSAFPEAAAAEAALVALGRPTDRFLDYGLKETMRGLEAHWRPALASGAPFATDNPKGLAYALESLDTRALRGVRPSLAKYNEVLSRPGMAPEDYQAAARGLGEHRGRSVPSELLAAIFEADAQGDPEDGALVEALFEALAEHESDPVDGEIAGLEHLATRAKLAITRRNARAAHLRASGDVDLAWASASQDVAALESLLRSLGELDRPHLAARLYPKVEGLLDRAPAELAGQLTGADQVRGRFVRVQLPGQKRTLTLAEVEVHSGGVNIAPRGTARQSSLNWGGVPERAMDGNYSPVWSDNGQTHTVEDRPEPFWELDLGGVVPIDRIGIWNRTDARWEQRLEGYTLQVLDAGRRVVFELHGQPAPNPDVMHELAPPAVRLRQAAAAGLLGLGVRTDEAVANLAGRFDDPELAGTVTHLLADLDPKLWPAEQAELVARRLEAAFGERPEASFAGAGGRAELALADALLTVLPRERALELYSQRRRIGPQALNLAAVPDRMLFDRGELTVAAGRPVELRFTNPDIMPHNWVLTAPGQLATVGRAADALSADPEADLSGYVPDHEAVLHASGLLQPGTTQTITFTAPEEPGDYPYVCTFPGHWVRMNGVLHVVDELGPATELPGEDTGSEGPTRAFVRDWSYGELWLALDDLTPYSADRGKQVFEAASCIRCHAVDGVGANTGPVLADVLRERERADVLRQILEPSREIRDGYRSTTFVTHDGAVHAGRVMEESAFEIVVMDDPYAEDLLVLDPKEIETREPSDLSMMPEGLLNTFTRQEILDLMAYLETLRKQD